MTTSPDTPSSSNPLLSKTHFDDSPLLTLFGLDVSQMPKADALAHIAKLRELQSTQALRATLGEAKRRQPKTLSKTEVTLKGLDDLLEDDDDES